MIFLIAPFRSAMAWPIIPASPEESGESQTVTIGPPPPRYPPPSPMTYPAPIAPPFAPPVVTPLPYSPPAYFEVPTFLPPLPPIPSTTPSPEQIPTPSPEPKQKVKCKKKDSNAFSPTTAVADSVRANSPAAVPDVVTVVLGTTTPVVPSIASVVTTTTTTDAATAATVTPVAATASTADATITVVAVALAPSSDTLPPSTPSAPTQIAPTPEVVSSAVVISNNVAVLSQTQLEDQSLLQPAYKSSPVQFKISSEFKKVKKGSMLAYIYSYRSSDKKTRAVTITRSVLDSGGRALFRSLGKRKLSRDKSFSIATMQRLNFKWKSGTYMVMVEVKNVGGSGVTTNFFHFKIT